MTEAPALDESAVAAIIDATNRALGEDLTRHTPEALARLASWCETLYDEIALAQEIQQAEAGGQCSITRQ